MELPSFDGLGMPGIVAAGEVIPQDPLNEEWLRYQAFRAGGGSARPFDASLRWDGTTYVVDPELAAIALANARENALKRVDEYHAETVQMLAGNPTQVEKDTWTLKLDTAAAIPSGGTLSPAGAQFLSGAGLDDDAARHAWAKSVRAKSEAYAKVVGLAERLRDDARTGIRAAATTAEIDAVLDTQMRAAEDAVTSLLR